jgi:hypothetical protein
MKGPKGYDMQKETSKLVEIDFMFLDREVCTRCKGTDVNLETALHVIRRDLESVGTQVRVRKTLVDSESKALELGFLTSPTILVNGRDIAPELLESSCASCAEACECEGMIDCRVWIYEGKEYTAAPVPLIIDAILAAVYDTKGSTPESMRAQSVPENLKRFFAAKAKAIANCCSPETQVACCEPSQKPSCCAPSEEAAEPAGCGCQ